MKARLDHVGIAVADLDAGAGVLPRRAGARDRSGRRRSRRSGCGRTSSRRGTRRSSCSRRRSETRRSRTYLAKRGPGLHHITLEVEDIVAALGELAARGVRLIDETPRPGAHGSLVAFIHPSSAHGRARRVEAGGGEGERRSRGFTTEPRDSGAMTGLGALGELVLAAATARSASTAAPCSASSRSRCGSGARRPTNATGSAWRCGRCWCAASGR